MNKRIFLAASALFLALTLSAQNYTGGVKGTVVSRLSKATIDGADLILYSEGKEVARVKAGQDGTFLIGNLKDGMYDLVIESPDYLQSRVNVTVNDGYVKNMFNLSLTPVAKVAEVDDASFSEFDMDDSGYQDSPTILFGQNDVFNNMAGYNFSSVRFRVRGYSSESQDVYLAGVRMNDAITGYTPYSLWSGLNEATRSKESVNGAEVSDFGFGGYNGLTNIMPMASSVRTGWRGSVLTNSALYRLRLMLTYASGQLDNGWSYAFSASARLGGNDWIKGVFYRSFGYYGAVEKRFGEEHKTTVVVRVVHVEIARKVPVVVRTRIRGIVPVKSRVAVLAESVKHCGRGRELLGLRSEVVLEDGDRLVGLADAGVAHLAVIVAPVRELLELHRLR